jgi:hypothetical protein
MGPHVRPAGKFSTDLAKRLTKQRLTPDEFILEVSLMARQ